MLISGQVRLTFIQIQLSRQIHRDEILEIEPKRLMQWSCLEHSQTQDPSGLTRPAFAGLEPIALQRIAAARLGVATLGVERQEATQSDHY